MSSQDISPTKHSSTQAHLCVSCRNTTADQVTNSKRPQKVRETPGPMAGQEQMRSANEGVAKIAILSETQLMMLRESYIEAEASRLLAKIPEPSEDEILRAYDEARNSLVKILR